MSIRRARNDDGVGLILVIGLSSIIMGLVLLSGTIASRSLLSSVQHVTYTQSMGAAEAGIDQTLARLQRAYVGFGTDYPVPSLPTTMNPAPTCQADPVDYTTPPAGFADAAAERAWAQAKIAALLVAQPNCLQTTSQGQFVVLKPANRQVVYAQGWSPSRTDKSVRTRLLKSEYLFVPYAPSHAVLTGGPISIDSATTVTTAAGSPANLAKVHSNATVTVATGNPIVYGEVSSTLSSGGASSNKFYGNTGGVVTTKPLVQVPSVSPLAVYNKWSASLRASWYNLCPDGKIKHPTSAGPCVSTASTDLVADLGPGGADHNTKVRGFRWEAASGSTAAKWKAGKNVPDGVYYAYASNIIPDVAAGNTETANATILAQPLDETACPKFGGSINWDHNNILTPVIPNLFMMAGGDLTTSANFYAGSAGPPVVSGFFLAGDQIHLSTAAAGAYGTMIAADQCPASVGEVNEIKNPAIYFDPTAESPFTDVINTTLWLEL